MTAYRHGDRCPVCGTGTLEKRTFDEVFEYKGRTATVPDYVVHQCSSCGEAIPDPESSRRADRVLREFHRLPGNPPA